MLFLLILVVSLLNYLITRRLSGGRA
jgi:hypothetical protein